VISKQRQNPKWDAFDRALLASAELDEPDAEALGRAARVLSASGLASAALVTSATGLGATPLGSGATATTASASVSAASTAAAGTSLAAVGKALLIGGALSVGVIGASHGALAPSFTPRQHEASPVVAARAKAAPAAASRGSRVTERTEVPAPAGAASNSRALALRAVPASSAGLGPVSTRGGAARASSASPARGTGAELEAPRAVASSAVVPESGPTGLAVEVAVLDRARAALARKDPSAALAELDRYSRLAGSGALVRESALLRIQALRDLGQKAEAAGLAAHVAAEDQQGLVGERAQELVK
jgi:hypothetical protein